MTEDWLGKWAVNQMLINVSTRKFQRSMRLPEGDVPAPKGSGLSKSAASRRFVALSAARLKEWMASDLSGLGLVVIQIDGIHMDEDMTLVAAIGVDVNGSTIRRRAGEIANPWIGKFCPGFQRRHVDMYRSAPIWRKIEGPTGNELLRRCRTHLNIHPAPVGKRRRIGAWNGRS